MASKRVEFWKSKEGLLLIEGWARDGLTDVQIARKMGICRATLNAWKKANKEILEKLKKGKDVADREVEKVLYEKALSGDVTAIIFWLKNRKPDEWRDKRETRLTGNVQAVPDRLIIDYGEK